MRRVRTRDAPALRRVRGGDVRAGGGFFVPRVPSSSDETRERESAKQRIREEVRRILYQPTKGNSRE